MKYRAAPAARPGEPSRPGVLIANLGTPDAPTPKALRRYLRQFLLDPRVIELPRPLWWAILHLAVLPTRPRKSAVLYRKVWTAEGSPLLVISRRQQAALAAELARRAGEEVPVALGMRYGNPSMQAALSALAEQGCGRILLLPLYPQYSAVTTGSTFDAAAAELATWRAVPELRTVHHYFDRPAYVEALAASLREAWQRESPGERLLFSFHGIPQRYADAGDPYPRHCTETARLAAERLGLPRERWVVSFQSLFGKEEWLKPYTERTIRELAASGVRRLDVVTPGFSADCLETIEEIDAENREVFLAAGGERYRYVPALNDRPDHIRALAELALENLQGWVAAAREPARARSVW
ncbi:MAG TPA: ferrochelatase [Thermoanaerobaculia bacterium]|nr:ferrochelatase [Thermoanaerobaculia bacterium]